MRTIWRLKGYEPYLYKKQAKLGQRLDLGGLAAAIKVSRQTLYTWRYGTETLPAAAPLLAAFLGCKVWDIWEVEIVPDDNEENTLGGTLALEAL